MELTINVTFGVTPELSAIARGWLGRQVRESAPLAEIAEEPKEPVRAPKKAKDVANTATAEEKPAEAKEKPLTEPQAPEPEPTEGKAGYSEEDVREAMHKCRLRIEGPDYKENTLAPGYVKHHRNLTQMFKNIASRLGYDKPSALPAELRKTFIDECEDIIVGDDGSLLTKVPF